MSYDGVLLIVTCSTHSFVWSILWALHFASCQPTIVLSWINNPWPRISCNLCSRVLFVVVCSVWTLSSMLLVNDIDFTHSKLAHLESLSLVSPSPFVLSASIYLRRNNRVPIHPKSVRKNYWIDLKCVRTACLDRFELQWKWDWVVLINLHQSKVWPLHEVFILFSN